MQFLTFLYIAIVAQHPVLLWVKGRGDDREGSDEQTVGTQLPARGMTVLPWA